MVNYLRTPTLLTLGWDGLLRIFERGQFPINAPEAVEQVFGQGPNRGSLVITGGSGIVGSGKAVQLGARLLDYDVPVITLDLPNAPNGVCLQYQGLVNAFGEERASHIASNIIH
ncbi:MAG: hypothetical protein ACK4OO_06790, partial [bacterium]